MVVIIIVAVVVHQAMICFDNSTCVYGIGMTIMSVCARVCACVCVCVCVVCAPNVERVDIIEIDTGRRAHVVTVRVLCVVVLSLSVVIVVMCVHVCLL